MHPMLAGWVGMIGMILMTHFGVFQIVACAWQRAGVPVRPLMNKPVVSGSVAEFWGRRWNVAFRDLADRLWFRPLLARFGKSAAALGVFAISGWLHELAISVPAGGGYGLPFGYFAIQGIGLLVERRWLGGRPWTRRLWTWLVVAGPVFWLFHRTFVTNVILPFMQAVGALGGVP
jgi:alginate O-acetyltransferase complex protein AlgI